MLIHRVDQMIMGMALFTVFCDFFVFFLRLETKKSRTQASQQKLRLAGKVVRLKPDQPDRWLRPCFRHSKRL